MSTFTTFESKTQGINVPSKDFGQWLDEKIKENNTEPPVDKNKLSPYEIVHNHSSSTISSSEAAAASEEEEESVYEEITK